MNEFFDKLIEMADNMTEKQKAEFRVATRKKMGLPPQPEPVLETLADTVHSRGILVVHHERLIAEVICKLLVHDGYEARMECSPREAIARAEELMPQLLIIDPIMPGISGVEVAKQICDRIECKVLLISASARETGFADLVNSLRNNGCDCEAFRLPFEKEELLEHVRERIGPALKTVTGDSVAEPTADLVQPKDDGEAKNRPTTLISLETIDAFLKSANVVTRMERSSLTFKGLIGETRIEISPIDFRKAAGLDISEIIRIESQLEKMPVTWNEGLLCAVNMAASNCALTVDSDARLRIKIKISVFSEEPREVVDVYIGIIFLGAMIHTNALQASMVDAFRMPISKAGPLPDSHVDGVWAPVAFERTVSLMRRGGVFSNGDDCGLTAEFPWDLGAVSAIDNLLGKRRKRTSMLRIECMEHPNLGKGLFCRLDLPLNLSDAEAFKLAIELNKMECTAADWPPFLGAWTSKPGSGRPTYVSFWPNCFSKVVSLELISTWHAARAKRVPEWVRSNTGLR
jgi:CheY-like chemotaxis protein